MWAFTKRILLFGLTNLLVILTLQLVLGVVLTFLGGSAAFFGSPAFQSIVVWALVWGFGGALISLAMSRLMARWMMGVQVIDPDTQSQSERELVKTVYSLAQKAGLTTMPQVGYYNSPEINAFATGPTKNRSLVAVSSGLLERMDRDQVEGVLGHEVAHIANGDMVTMTLIQGVVNSFVLLFSRLFASVISNQVEEKMRHIVHFAVYFILQIAFGLLGSLVVNWFSQQREFRADAGSARIAGKRKMIAALRGLAQVHPLQADQENDQPALATLKISASGSGGSLWSRLLSTHPSLEERIHRLEQMPSL